ncbi:MAG: hypothetical protein ACWIPJ_08785 [Polaribacter sp.]
MGFEKDLIKREINKLMLALTALIEKASGLNANNAVDGIEETTTFLKANFNLNILEIIELENTNLQQHISKLHPSHIEKLAELLYEIVKKWDVFSLETNYNKKKLAEKTVLLINYLDANSKTFSMKRMHIKNELQIIVFV